MEKLIPKPCYLICGTLGTVVSIGQEISTLATTDHLYWMALLTASFWSPQNLGGGMSWFVPNSNSDDRYKQPKTSSSGKNGKP